MAPTLFRTLLTILSLLIYARESMSFKVPTKLPDGVYEVSINANTQGRQFVIAQYDLDPLLHVNVTAKFNRDRPSLPISLVQCPKPAAGAMDWAHAEIARDLLGTWCELYHPKNGGIVMAVYGNSSYYFCDYNNPPVQGDQERSCSRKEVDLQSRKITEWCGERKGGYVQAEGWGMAYGRSLREMEICPRLEGRDRRYDKTLPFNQHHRLESKGGSGVYRGDRVRWGKNIAGIWGLKKLGKSATDWRGPKGEGNMGSSGGKGRKRVGKPTVDPEAYKRPGWADGLNYAVTRQKYKRPQKPGKPLP